MIPSVVYGFEIEPKGKTASFMEQIHSAQIIEALLPAEKDGYEKPKADAVVTQKSDLAIHVFTADCCPVLFYSAKDSGPIAAIHSGWRGTMQGIVRKTAERFFCDPFYVVIGPCIRSCCFEVKTDFIEAFSQARGDISKYVSERQKRFYFDLVGFIVERELGGLSIQGIDFSFSRCTVCSEPRLPSYRRNGSTDPRMRAWIKRRSQNQTGSSA